MRVSVALGFGRGRLKSVYQVLRGKDVETGEFSIVHREKQFAILQEAQAHVLAAASNPGERTGLERAAERYALLLREELRSVHR